MCGILGLVADGETGVSVAPARIAKALGLTRHRGPDRGYLTFLPDNQPAITLSLDMPLPDLPSVPAVLGHNRLCIIDLSDKADQPMPYAGRYWLTYNGEIYNYRELRGELEARGYRFASQSDSEILLALYDAYGPAMTERLNGMFALGIWDAQRRTLFLARDRYGIKPLYYTRLPGSELAFASEIKSLLMLGADKILNMQALSEHLTFQNMLEGRTLLKSIQLLEPGHRAIWQSGQTDLHIERYWEPVFTPQTSISEAESIRNLRELFEQAVTRQLVGDVPIGSFLSGGMDTGAITAVTSRRLPGLHTFTAGFETGAVSDAEQLFDERQVARELAQAMGTHHHEMRIDADALPAILPRVVWHLDDFRAGISYQNYLVSRMVGDHVTVVLSGVGGDELFGGYPWRYEPLLQIGPGDFANHYYQAWVRLLSETEKQALFTPEAWRALGRFSSRDSFERVLSSCRAEISLDKALCYDMKTLLHGLLAVEDRLSMAHSLESRVPFLDNALVDACLGLPHHFKLREGRAKWILKEALRGLLPDAVLDRRKQGFTPPDASWYRGPMRGYIEELLLSPRALGRGLFRPEALQALLEAHFNGQRNHRFLLWSLMCLEWWQRQLLDPAEPEPFPTPQALVGAHIL